MGWGSVEGEAMRYAENKKGTRIGALFVSIWRAREHKTGHWETKVILF